MKKLLLIDNYDSFTYNLVQYFQQLGVEVIVKYNDEITVEQAQELNPDYLVFSPGPGTVENPKDIGNGIQLLEAFLGKIPILGVCLGHQMIGKYFGGKIIKIEPQHGKRWPIKVLEKEGLFRDFPDEFEGMRYHSMVVNKQDFPLDRLNISAKTLDETCIMALEQVEKKLFGVQFHPESIGTPTGMKILKNFLNFG
jgi:anthranilate synthase/aminodeoxychorismate synthase-like glutamine amidotransferase